jgi:hypothetical protein
LHHKSRVFEHFGVLMANKTLIALMFLCSYALVPCIFAIAPNPSSLTPHPFTTVESALQIGPFCTNKPNFRKSQMNVNKVLTRDYDKLDTWSIGKNKPNSNPIQTQYKAKTNPISEPIYAAAYDD